MSCKVYIACMQICTFSMSTVVTISTAIFKKLYSYSMYINDGSVMYYVTHCLLP